MRKFLVVIAVIFIFLCGITKSNAAKEIAVPDTTTANIEAVDYTACKTSNTDVDKFFISSNLTNTYKYIFSQENFSSADNNNFDINNLFTLISTNLKQYNKADGYLLSLSSNPRAP